MKDQRFIYALVDSDDADSEWRYIGCTKDPKKRQRDYRRFVMDAGHLSYWLSSLRLPPELIVLAEVNPPEEWRTVERAWITQALERGYRLVNGQHHNGRRSRPPAPRPVWQCEERTTSEIPPSLIAAERAYQDALIHAEALRLARNREVCRAVESGCPNTEIARALGMSRAMVGKIFVKPT